MPCVRSSGMKLIFTYQKSAGKGVSNSENGSFDTPLQSSELNFYQFQDVAGSQY